MHLHRGILWTYGLRFVAQKVNLRFGKHACGFFGYGHLATYQNALGGLGICFFRIFENTVSILCQDKAIFMCYIRPTDRFLKR